MPIAIHLKRPPVTLVVKGQFKDRSARTWRKELGGFLAANDVRTGDRMLICTSDDCNIGYMSELTEDRVQELLEKQKKKGGQGDGNRIVRPTVVPVIPSGRLKR